jgi:hypothetical protein
MRRRVDDAEQRVGCVRSRSLERRRRGGVRAVRSRQLRQLGFSDVVAVLGGLHRGTRLWLWRRRCVAVGVGVWPWIFLCRWHHAVLAMSCWQLRQHLCAHQRRVQWRVFAWSLQRRWCEQL